MSETLTAGAVYAADVPTGTPLSLPTQLATAEDADLADSVALL